MTPPPIIQESAPPTVPAAVKTTDAEAEQEKLKAIRDILVGDQLQGLNNRFQRMEKTLDGHYDKLSDALTTKFEALEVLSKAEIRDVTETVVEMVTQLQKEDAALSEELDSGLKQVAEIDKRVTELKEVLAEQIRKMHKEFYNQMSEFSRLVKSQQEEVARKAVSRDEFATVLHGLAGSLAPEESTAEESESEIMG